MVQNTEVPFYNTIIKNIESLYLKIHPDNVDDWYEDLKSVIQIFTTGERLREIRPLLENVQRHLMSNLEQHKENIEKVDRLIKMLRTHEPDFLLERLKIVGRVIAQNKALQDALDKQMFRILEQVRLGKKDSAIHIILRTFVANHKQIPKELIDAMKEQYDINQFRAFMYAFLNNFIAESNIKEDNYAG